MGLFQLLLCKYMKGILNGKLVETSNLSPQLFERAYHYGDGLFETIMVKNGTVKLLDYHFARLKRAMRALSMESDLTEANLNEYIQKLVEVEQIKETGRIKLLVWRQAGGLYTPGTAAVEILLFAVPYIKRDSIIYKSEIAERINLTYSSISEFKTNSALPYVMAGIEKRDKGLDEIIILDNFQNLSECSSSNLFWIENNKIYTPSLKSGCIAGVMRSHILHQAKLSGRAVFEVLEKPGKLSTANQVFCCNVTGVYIFESFRNKKFDITLDPDIAAWINQ